MEPKTYAVNTAPEKDAALSSLVTDLVDVIRGYDEMKKRAEPDLRPAVERLHTLHEAHAARLMAGVAERGGDPDDAGSVMGRVHEAVAVARDWFGTLDCSAIDEIVDGEKRLIESYDDAAKALPADDEMRAIVTSQRQELEDALHRIGM